MLKPMITQFTYYKTLVDKSIQQISNDDFFKIEGDGNSVAILMNHISGNIRSRFTDFLTSDGEKSWRDRDKEFEPSDQTKDQLLQEWDAAWIILFETLHNLIEDDLDRIVYIRNEGHTVTEALLRQFAHYAYHIGQIVFIAKLYAGEKWVPLSVPKGQSKAFNDKMFSKEKGIRNFTDSYDEQLGNPTS